MRRTFGETYVSWGGVTVGLIGHVYYTTVTPDLSIDVEKAGDSVAEEKNPMVITEEMAEELRKMNSGARGLFLLAAFDMHFGGKYADGLPEWCRDWMETVKAVQDTWEIKQKKRRMLRTSEYRQILAYLNQKTGRDFRLTASVQDKIDARIREGAVIEDFFLVIDNKASEWSSDGKMRKYLRPETLFGNRFDTYRTDGKGGTFAESSFETDDMFAAALRKSYGEDLG